MKENAAANILDIKYLVMDKFELSKTVFTCIMVHSPPNVVRAEIVGIMICVA